MLFQEGFNVLQMRGLFIVILLLLFFFSPFTYGQKTIEGHVYNRQNEPVPYTSIYDSASQQGTYSDVNGYFRMNVAKLPVTLKFSNVGYETKEVYLSTGDTAIIFLEEKIIHLEEVVVRAEALEYQHIGSPKNRKGITTFHVLDPFDQYAIVVNNDKDVLYTNPELISFSLKIAPGSSFGVRNGNDPTGKKQLRLRMYKRDSNKIIGDDILHENVFLSPSKKGWYEVSLEEININLPREGFVLAVEWIEDNPTYHYEIKNKDDKKVYQERQYGVSIRGHKMSDTEKAIYETVRLLHITQRGWEKETTFKNYIPCFRLEFFEKED